MVCSFMYLEQPSKTPNFIYFKDIEAFDQIFGRVETQR